MSIFNNMFYNKGNEWHENCIFMFEGGVNIEAVGFRLRCIKRTGHSWGF